MNANPCQGQGSQKDGVTCAEATEAGDQHASWLQENVFSDDRLVPAPAWCGAGGRGKGGGVVGVRVRVRVRVRFGWGSGVGTKALFSGQNASVKCRTKCHKVHEGFSPSAVMALRQVSCSCDSFVLSLCISTFLGYGFDLTFWTLGGFSGP